MLDVLKFFAHVTLSLKRAFKLPRIEHFADFFNMTGEDFAGDTIKTIHS